MMHQHPYVLPNFLDVAARSRPSGVALSFDTQKWTFVELRAAVSTAAQLLLREMAHSADRGRIGILSANRPGFVFTVHAAAQLGVSYVPLNWRQTPDELAWQLRDAGVALLVCDESRLEAARAATVGFPMPIVSIDELERRSEPRPITRPAPAIALDREATAIYTSGTSGRPKGARLSYGNLWFSAVASALHLGARDDDQWLACLPLFHVGGLSILYRGVIGANSIHLHERFEPDSVLAALDRGVTHASLVPTLLRQLVNHRGSTPWPAELRCLLLGGAPAPIDLIELCVERQIPVAPTYGLTESSSQAATLRSPETPQRPGSSGMPLPTTQMRIVDQGQALGSMEVGEIELRGPTIFGGYLGGASPSAADGWLATGDSGYLDGDGYLYVVDRRDDLIVSGGENIYPAEIERVLLTHPLVSDAGVIGLNAEPWGQRPVALVVWRGNPEQAQESLLAHCRESLARYKVPDRIVVVDELPRTTGGKLSRKRIRDEIDG
jgi:O-succinylbenzoic acid--CoA ligase